MRVVGLGVDLVEWARVARSLERWGDRFVAKLMDPEEAERLPPGGEPRVLALALAVAGKEAASKALGTGWSQGVRWRDVVVDLGPPPARSSCWPAPPWWRAASARRDGPA